jgi:uncharacterized protein YbjQ (UPF0145 family)
MVTMRRVQITTTGTIAGWQIESYLGPVVAHVVAGTGLFSDIAASLTDFFGGRSGTYQKQLARIREEALLALEGEARRLGANWVIGTRIEFDEISGKNVQMFMVTASGTAVRAHNAREDMPDSALPDTIPPERVLAEVEAERIRAEAASGTLFMTEQRWAIVSANLVGGLLKPILQYVCRNRDAAASWESLKRTFPSLSDFLDGLPWAEVQEELYGLAQEERTVRVAALLLRARGLIDVERTLSLLQADSPLVRAIGLHLLRQGPSAFREDSGTTLRTAAEAVERSFIVRWRREEKQGLMGTRVIWHCPCGEPNIDGAMWCSRCNRDAKGLAMNDPKPEEVAAGLRAWASAIERLRHVALGT